MGNYRQIAVETFWNVGERSPRSLRARPLPGQGLSTRLRVQCSEKMRQDYPPGTVFIVRAQVTDREGVPYLSTHHDWPFQVVSQKWLRLFEQVFPDL